MSLGPDALPVGSRYRQRVLVAPPLHRLRAVTPAVFSLAVALAAPTSAHAQLREAEPSGSYGRLSHDLAMSITALGGVAGPDVFDSHASLSLAGELRARILDSGGLVAAIDARPDTHVRAFFGVDLRPLFLARFFTVSMSDDRFVDLLIDSIGLDVGVTLLPLGDALGAAFSIGGGLDVPLAFFDSESNGLFLRLGARGTFANAGSIGGPNVTGSVADIVVHAGLGIRFLGATGLSNWEPTRYRVP